MGREPGGAAGPAAAFPCTWTPIKRPPAERGDVTPLAAAVGDCFQREFSPLSVFSSHVLKRSLHKSEENCGHPVTDGHRSRGATLQCPAASCRPRPTSHPPLTPSMDGGELPGGPPAGSAGGPVSAPSCARTSQRAATPRGVSLPLPSPCGVPSTSPLAAVLGRPARPPLLRLVELLLPPPSERSRRAAASVHRRGPARGAPPMGDTGMRAKAHTEPFEEPGPARAKPPARPPWSLPLLTGDGLRAKLRNRKTQRKADDSRSSVDSL